MLRLAPACLFLLLIQSQSLFSQMPIPQQTPVEKPEYSKSVIAAIEAYRSIPKPENPFASLTIIVRNNQSANIKLAKLTPEFNSSNTMFLLCEIGVDGELYYLPHGNIACPRSSPFESLATRIKSLGRWKDNCQVDIVIRTQNGKTADLQALAQVVQKLNELDETIAKFEKFQLLVCLEKDKKRNSSTDNGRSNKKERAPEQETETKK